MSEINLTFLDTNEIVKIPVASLQQFKTGGEGRLYIFYHKQTKYILKAMPDKQEIFERMKLIRTTLLIKKSHIPASIWHGGLHVAQGHCDPLNLNFKIAKGVYLLAFNFISGKTLDETLADKPIPLNSSDQFRLYKDDFPERLRIAKKIADILFEIQKAGIIHGDIFFDNFMMDTSGEIFAIDFGGAGLYDKLKGEWIQKANIAGKFDSLGLPKPFEMNDIIEPSLYSDRWAGMLLIWWILTGTRHPYWMLKHLGPKALTGISEKADRYINVWPPKFTNGMNSLQFCHEKYPYSSYTDFMTTVFGQNSSYGRLVHANFIYGYKKPLNRPDFKSIKEALLILKN